ncbi:MAG: zinc-ribbon domain-containing protein [Saprospiraceae bacterium]|nr:zinc-ribbon domain-containing protein [Saprospiraceae bacterium]
MDTVKSHICLNCKAPLADDDKFCTQCGQGTQEHLLNFKELVIHFVEFIYQSR